MKKRLAFAIVLLISSLFGQSKAYNLKCEPTSDAKSDMNNCIMVENELEIELDTEVCVLFVNFPSFKIHFSK